LQQAAFPSQQACPAANAAIDPNNSEMTITTFNDFILLPLNLKMG
jgi:hypothetical protein